MQHKNGFVENTGTTPRQRASDSSLGAEYKWQGNTLRLDKGKLTFNGKDYSTLKEGDRFRVDKDGDLFINGKQQP